MKRKIAIIILLILGVFGAVAAKTGMFTEFETAFAEFINPNRNSGMFFRIFSEIGEFYCVISIIAVLFIFKNCLVLALPAGISTAITFICGEILKRLVARPRPEEALRLLDISGYSFPSGHALNAAALYTAIIYCSFKLLKTETQKIICTSVLSAVALLIGLSRIYFNVHYLTDVLSGFFIGTAMSLIICPLVIKFAEKKVN